MLESKTGEVTARIGDLVLAPGPLNSLLQFVYADDAKFAPDHALYLLEAASYFGFTNLRLLVRRSCLSS